MENKLASCPVRLASAVLGGKWAPLVLHELRGKCLRFADIRRATVGISDKMLTQELRALESHGLISRHDHSEVPPRVDYQLTPLGDQALDVVDALATFGFELLARQAPNANKANVGEGVGA